jgi:hypothetical protein
MSTNIGVGEIPDREDFKEVMDKLGELTENGLDRLQNFLSTNKTAQTVIQTVKKLLI